MTADLGPLLMRARGVVAFRVAAVLDDDDVAAVMASHALAELPTNVRDIAWARLVQRAAEVGDLEGLLLAEMQDAQLFALVTEAGARIVTGAEALLAEPPADPATREPDPEP